VGCAVNYDGTSLSEGKLSHLGVALTDKGLELPDSVLPPFDKGKYSRMNIEGQEVIRNDLPKETHYHAVEAPDWKGYGTHTVNLPHEQYPRDFIPPQETEIVVRCRDTRPSLRNYIIAFRVNEVLDRTGIDFEKRLLVNLNLLQENVGHCGVEAAESSISEYARSLNVSWEILPPGTRDEVIERLFRGKTPTAQDAKVAAERYDFFMSLSPQRLVFGTSGFRRYFGALIEENLVVFENIQYGNAIYVLLSNWESLSRRSRVELLSGKYGTDFSRVIHRPGWKNEVKLIIDANRTEIGGSSRKRR
jgi:hypothetical protein